jgi:hypothetical protein
VRRRLESPWAIAFYSLLCFAPGAFLLGIATDAVPYDPAKVHAPAWVLAIAGAMFIACGFVVLANGFQRAAWVGRVAGPCVLLGLAAIANWVAFGDGDRHFSGGLEIAGTSASGPVNEVTGRAAFGFAALLLDLVTVVWIWQWSFGKRDPPSRGAG